MNAEQSHHPGAGDVPITSGSGPSDPIRLGAEPGTWVEAVIDAPVERVVDMVSDITLPTRFSEKFLGVSWAESSSGRRGVPRPQPPRRHRGVGGAVLRRGLRTRSRLRLVDRRCRQPWLALAPRPGDRRPQTHLAPDPPAPLHVDRPRPLRSLPRHRLNARQGAPHLAAPPPGVPRQPRGSGLVLLRFLIGRGRFAQVERWQTSYLPVFPIWAALVVLVFPPVFAFA